MSACVQTGRVKSHVHCCRYSGEGKGSQSTSRRSLATAQHLCGSLVGFVDPGFVGIGLEDKNNTYRYNRCFSVCLFSKRTGSDNYSNF